MKINRLEITNFLGLTAELDFTQPINVIFGPNGIGKTAVLDAIYWAFIGNCPGRGIKNLNQGPMLATNGVGDVIVDCFTSEGQVHRSFKNKKGSKFDPSFVIKEEDWAVILNPSRVLAMDAKSRQAVLGRLLRGEGVTKKITECLQKHALSQEARTKIHEDMDKAQKWAVTRRQEANRSVNDLTAARPELPPLIVEIGDEKVDLTEHSLQEVEQRLTDRRSERLAKQAEIAHAAAVVDIEQVQIVIGSNSLKLDALEENLAHLHANHVAHQPKLEKAEKDHQDAWKTAQDLDSDWKSANKDHEAAKTITGVCPTCQKTMTIAARKKLLETLDQAEKIALGNSGIANEKYRKAQEVVQGLNQQQRAASEELQKDGRQVQQLQDAIEIQEKQIKVAESAIPRQAKLRAELEDFDQRVGCLTAMVEAKRAYKTAVETIASLNAQIEKAQADHAAFDKVDQLLKPDGELRQIANEGLSNLEFDAPLAAAWGMGSLEIKPDGSIMVYNRPIEMASVTEKWRVSVLVSELLSRAAGAGILILDGVDILTDTRQALQERLEEWQSVYDTIILNVAIEEPPEKQAPDGWKYFWVADGTVKPVSEAEASGARVTARVT